MSKPFVSYAQNFEDVLLRRVFGDVERGFYVDVGAADPVQDSVTKSLYEAGWCGINVEPTAACRRLRKARPRDVTLAVAVAEHAGRMPMQVFYGDAGVMGVSRLCPDAITAPARFGQWREEVVQVEVLPLATLLAQHAADRHIHFLKVDVEGAEEAVLRGNDWQRFRPEVVLAEATRPQSTERTDAAWAPILLQAGYRQVWFDGLNAWFLREESAHRAVHFQVPPNVFDNFVVAEAAMLRQLSTELRLPQGSRALRSVLPLARLLRRAFTIGRARPQLPWPALGGRLPDAALQQAERRRPA